MRPERRAALGRFERRCRGRREDDRADERPRPRRGRRVGPGSSCDRPPPPGDHRLDPDRRAADERRRARAHRRLQRLHLQLPSAAPRARGRRPPLRVDIRHRGGAAGLRRVGHPLHGALCRDVCLRHRRARHRPPGARPRPAGHQTALPQREPRAAALRFDPAGAGGGGRGRHRHRPGGAAPLPELSLRRPRPPHDPRRGTQAASGDRPRGGARRHQHRHGLLVGPGGA